MKIGLFLIKSWTFLVVSAETIVCVVKNLLNIENIKGVLNCGEFNPINTVKLIINFCPCPDFSYYVGKLGER